MGWQKELSGEGGIRSWPFSQTTKWHCITPKGAHSLRVALFWTLVVVSGCLESTEKTILPTKDYSRQIPREQPLREARFENLRIVPDTLWFVAQARLAKNPCIRGRRAKYENADPSLRILSGLFWCPEHDRPMRACSAYGQYLGCPSCATLGVEKRPLFSEPDRKVVLRLLCEKLAELIQQDVAQVDQIISESQAHAAKIQRPDESELERHRLLEQIVAQKAQPDGSIKSPICWINLAVAGLE